MKRITLVLPYLLLFSVLLFFGVKWIEVNKEPRFIDVTGSAELELEADEIHFTIGIREYYNPNYRISSREYIQPDKVGIDSIESQLFRQLSELNITAQDIVTNSAGNYQSYQSGDPLIRKEFGLVLSSMNEVNTILETCSSNGVQYMNISKMTNSKIEDFRKEVKQEAVLAAEQKAEYLLSVIGEEKADLISLIEINEGDEQGHPWYMPQLLYSNAVLDSRAETDGNALKKIKLRYAVNVKYEIH